jgi:hypothetical protein
MEQHEEMSEVHICKCTNKLHEDILAANKTYKVGTTVRIIEES